MNNPNLKESARSAREASKSIGTWTLQKGPSIVLPSTPPLPTKGSNAPTSLQAERPH